MSALPGGVAALRQMLDAAIRDYAAHGVLSCAVDLEAFNPEASRFWIRHFAPVCYSLMGVPETMAEDRPDPRDTRALCRIPLSRIGG